MFIVKAEGAPPCCRSEREFMRAVHDQPGVYIANANVPNSSAPGAFTREVDGVMLTPESIYTVEVKGIRATGELTTPRMDAWAVVDQDTRVPLKGRPHAQALAHSKYLATFLKDTGIPSGWIRAVLAIVGEGITLPEGANMHLTENVHVVLSKPGVGEVLRTEVASTMPSRELSVETVQTILDVFECGATAPTIEDLLAEGFRTEAVIAAEIEAKRQRVREEYLAATTHPVSDEPAPEATEDDPTVADGPSVHEWAITQERFNSTLALDDELTETGAFVDGVAMHKRLVSYAERKDVSLSLVASIVNDPIEVLGDESDTHHVYCGNEYAVSVRMLDRLAMFYKTVDLAKAERSGATVNGVVLSARAAKQAINQFSLSLESVARIISDPEERWWIPGTTDIAHARGDFVAVTHGHLGPVQYVQTRAMAVHRAAPKATQDEPAEVQICDQTVQGITIRASAVGWCHRRNVSLDSIAGIVANPTGTWAGHSETMEVRAGTTNAVLLDVAENAVVAVMTAAEAVEYRDGIVRDGVRLSGRCVFLAKRRKRSIEEIIASFKQPLTLARALGSTFTYYIGESLAVTVEDETNAVVDFTYADHARAMLRRGELVSVDPHDHDHPAPTSVPRQRAGVPNPATVAAMIGAPKPPPAAESGSLDTAPSGEGVPSPLWLARPRSA